MSMYDDNKHSTLKTAAVVTGLGVVGAALGVYLYRRKHPVSPGYSTLPLLADLGGAPRGHFQVAPDGAVEFRSKDGLGVLDWLTSQLIMPSGSDVTVFKIMPTPDGRPIPPGASAKDFAVSAALAGFNVMARPSIMTADGKEKDLKFTKDSLSAKPEGGWAIIVRADPKGGGTMPSLPAMPGFTQPGLALPSTAQQVLKPNADPYSGMPQDLAQKVQAVLTKPGANPADLEAAAKDLEANYPAAAVLLNKKAADLKGNKALESVTSGAALLVPRDQVEAKRLAMSFAGPDGQYAALRRANPQIALTPQGLTPWVPGQVVRLPLTAMRGN